MNRRSLQPLAEEALDAFWEVIASRFPEARSGDASIDIAIDLRLLAEEAIASWIENNVPDLGESAPTPRWPS